MARVTRYFKRDRVLGARFRRLLRLFALDLTPAQIAALTRLSPNTVARYVRLFRERIAAACDAQAKLSGVVEVDESYFGRPPRVGRSGTRSERQSDRVRHVQARRASADRSGRQLPQSHAGGGFAGEGGFGERHSQRRVCVLQQRRGAGLQDAPTGSPPPRVRPRRMPHQRH